MSKITLKGIIDEDFVNYRVPSMTLMFPYCSFKCGTNYCQNWSLTREEDIRIPVDKICERYINNPISEAIVFQGLEPFDSYNDVYKFISTLRNKYHCMDNIVIYTGFDKDEIVDKVEELKIFKNIIIKFGRYIPGQDAHYDDVLGVKLSSNNQYAERIS